ncbi:MAG TPA: type III-A CRISPR-associated RAMP protein Csm3 [Saprospiraceae bacterium]|nr:type III-A CRISPR-associated RAMP protein Csm3 [Saprospiraceae bacterium]
MTAQKSYQLSKKILIKGKIIVKTGLHIGGSNNALSIGGMDNAVIRNPISNEPYIPGSSLKGKMRSLLELAYGYIIERNMGNVKNIGDDNANLITTQLFGSARNDADQRPSRVIVRDAHLLNPEKLAKTELLYTEGKTEVVIDRITSSAVPRQLERVPAGAEFGLDLVLNIIEEDNRAKEEELIEQVFKSLQMVQDDYLGGSGSRGSGQVMFEIHEVHEKSASFYTSNQKEVENKVEYYHKFIPQIMRKKDQK